jgi:thiol-disulfide isomerase/thioredoxin
MDQVGLTAVVVVLVAGTAAGLWRRRTDGRFHDATPRRDATQPAATPPATTRLAATRPAATRLPATSESVSEPTAAAEPALSSIATAESASTATAEPAHGRTAAAESAPASIAPAEVALGPTPTADSASHPTAAGPIATTGSFDQGWNRDIVPDTTEEPGVLEQADASADGVRLDPALLRRLGVEPARATLLQFSSAFCAPCRAVRRVSSEVAALLPGVRHVEVDAESHLDAVRALDIWRTPTLLVLDADGRVAKRATGVPGKPQLIAVLGEIL